MSYDIFLYMGCQTSPDLQDLAQDTPKLSDPMFQSQLLKQTAKPGWLELELAYTTATTLLQRLKDRMAVGVVAQSAYRHPVVTRDQAETIAQPVMAQKQAQRFPGYTFSTVHFSREQPVCWEFEATSGQLGEEGHIPGALYVCVDKLDGHIWQQEEFDRLRGE